MSIVCKSCWDLLKVAKQIILLFPCPLTGTQQPEECQQPSVQRTLQEEGDRHRACVRRQGNHPLPQDGQVPGKCGSCVWLSLPLWLPFSVLISSSVLCWAAYNLNLIYFIFLMLLNLPALLILL